MPTAAGIELQVVPHGACRAVPVGGLDESAGLYRVTRRPVGRSSGPHGGGLGHRADGGAARAVA